MTDTQPPRSRVLLRGAESPLGWSISAALGNLSNDDLVIDGPADIIVDVGLADYDLVAERGESPTVDAAELLDAADRLGAQHLVLLTSAKVYGALSSNPIPLTEAAVLRPEPAFVYARQLAAAEELVEAWRRAGSDRTVTVLRPVTPVDARGVSSLARALTNGLGQRWGESDPGGQFVHQDDIASAVALAVERRLDGVYNVAPDGSIAGDALRQLAGKTVRVPLPARVREVIESLRWRFQRGPIPPGLSPYIHEPWIVANDKLRAEGWNPEVTNEQAFVEGTEAKWWSMVTPKRRQEFALAAVGLLAASAVGAVAVAVWRWWRARSRR